MAVNGQVQQRLFTGSGIASVSNLARQPSNNSDVSASPSEDSGSATSSMASGATKAHAQNRANGHENSKYTVEHVENTEASDVHMSNKMHDITSPSHVDSGGPSGIVKAHKPRPKFMPEPLETTTRSSRKERQMMGDSNEGVSPSKRKFAPEPIETSTRSSKAKNDTKPRRRFDVQPIETSMISSKDKDKNKAQDDSRPKRKFAVEPFETSTTTSKERKEDGQKPRRKFAVEPVETTASSSRRRRDQNSPSDSMSSSQKSQDSLDKSSTSGRKFSPELIATARASYRKKPEVKSAVPEWLKDEVDDTNSWSAPEPEESRFSAASLAKRARAESRRHSYCVPDLPMIQSDSSEEELLTPQTPAVMSHFNSRDNNIPRLSKNRHKHNHEQQRQHLEALATLRDQAVAAYGQQEHHVPFGHYGGDSDDEDYSLSVGQLSIEDNADPSLFRRMSGHDLHLVMEDMQRHHSQLEKAKRDLQEDTAGISRFSAAALAARHHLKIGHPAGSGYGSQRETKPAPVEEEEEDNEFAKMRKAASPPMGGEEIKFPFSVTPKMTRCDPDQAPRPRRANSEEEEHDIGTAGMWSAHIKPSEKDAPVGLWGGLCQKDESRPARPTTPQRSGLQTPAFEQGNPFESRTPGRGTRTPRRLAQPWTAGAAWMPLTPPRSKQEKSNNSDAFAATLDSKLTLERQIDDEFPPRVITQIYNYLSLGYPAIARPFDDELSKISRIPIIELRKGDRSDTGSLRGHVGVPEGEGDAEEDDDGRVKGCRRWDALRLYVKEWARQSPTFAELGNVSTDMWGNNAPVRKGSWGF